MVMTLRGVLASKQAFESESGHVAARAFLNPDDFAGIPWSDLYPAPGEFLGLLQAIGVEWVGDPEVPRGEVRFSHVR
jgi:hypothetical protein